MQLKSAEHAYPVGRWVFVVLVWLTWATTIVAGMCFPQFYLICLAIAFGMLPLVVPVILMLIASKVFGLRYGPLGWLERTPIPRTELVSKHSSLAPNATFYVCEHGLGIDYYLLGEAYLPYASIQAFRRALAWTEISHACPEIRTPVHVPQAVALAVKEAVERIG